MDLALRCYGLSFGLRSRFTTGLKGGWKSIVGGDDSHWN